MSAGSILVPSDARPPARRATVDARGAGAISLGEYLRASEFLLGGGEDADQPFRLRDVLYEWPEPKVAMVYPSVSIIDREDIAVSPSSFVPVPLEETWDEFGAGTVLWKLGEVATTVQVDFWSDSKPMREAIAAQLPSLFAPGEDATRVVLRGTTRYWCRPVRASLVSWRRMDEPGSVYVRERRLMAVVRLDVDVVDLRCAYPFQPSVVLTEVGETVDVGTPPDEFGRLDTTR